MTGFLGKSKYFHIHFFVDDASDFTFTHHAKSIDVAEALEAKRVYEREIYKYGKEVKYIHAGNGTYACKGCKDAVHDSKQLLTCCGVGAHFQNGKAENRIKIVTHVARTSLINAMHKWPGVVTASLCPFAISAATQTRNKYKLDAYGLNAEERLSGIRLDKKELFNLKDEHVLFCPCFVLNSRIQDNNSMPKWDERVRVGMHVGKSQQHAGNVSLLLNLSTGYVSPQFHVVFDDNFETVEYLEHGTVPKRWTWLCEHTRKVHHDNEGNILDNTKVWTNAELESSTFFDVPKHPSSILLNDEHESEDLDNNINETEGVSVISSTNQVGESPLSEENEKAHVDPSVQHQVGESPLSEENEGAHVDPSFQRQVGELPLLRQSQEENEGVQNTFSVQYNNSINNTSSATPLPSQIEVESNDQESGIQSKSVRFKDVIIDKPILVNTPSTDVLIHDSLNKDKSHHITTIEDGASTKVKIKKK